MMLYNSMSPNGFRVSAFLAEKEIEVPITEINIMEGETRKPDHLARNSLGEVPVLELDDGTFLPESVAICRYFEDLYPEPALFGETAQEKALVEMWNRRMERHIMDSTGDVALHEFPIFADKIEQSGDYATIQRRQFAKNLGWFDSELSDGREFVAGDKYSVADITATAALIICQYMEHEVSSEFSNVKRWQDRMQSRKTWPF
ncbi:MAG: glutathione S-transferase family protein [Pseudomonadota bacterium]